MSIVATDVNKVIRKQVENICTLNCSTFFHFCPSFEYITVEGKKCLCLILLTDSLLCVCMVTSHNMRGTMFSEVGTVLP
jgi:hypothetical protein